MGSYSGHVFLAMIFTAVISAAWSFNCYPGWSW